MGCDIIYRASQRVDEQVMVSSFFLLFLIFFGPDGSGRSGGPDFFKMYLYI